MADEKNDFVEVDSAKLYTALIGSLMDECNEALYPGDERRIFGEGLVKVFVALFSEFNDKMKMRTLRYARGVVLDAIGERLNVYRLQPASASAVFRFTASAVMGTNIVIPAGTRITTDGSVYFATTEAAVLPSGSLYVDAEAVSTEGGSVHNGYMAGAVATLVDLVPYISAVENITETAGGDDGEPYTEEGDERLRERIRLAPSTLSTAGPESAYRYFVLTADSGIVNVAIDCPVDEPNTVNIYPLMAGGELPTEETIQKILDVLADDVRPMVDLVQVFPPETVEYDIEIKYYCTKDDEPSVISTIEGDGGAIDKYNEWQTTALGRDINPDQLRRFVLAPSSGVGALRVDVVSPAHVTLNKWQVGRFSGKRTVSYEVVEG